MDNYFYMNNENIDGTIADAPWIWGGNNPRTMNRYRLFRKEIHLNEKPFNAEIIIYGESRYKLYVNGEFVLVGPTPCQPEERLFDRYDIGKYLLNGDNCIGVEVYCPGIMTGQWTIVNPALLVSIRVGSGDVTYTTDSSWRTIQSKAWMSNTQLCPYAKGFQEFHDMTSCSAGWKSTGFDDSDWENAIELPFFSYSADTPKLENYIGYPTLARQAAEQMTLCGTVSGVITDEMQEKASSLYKWVRNRWRKQMGQWNIGYDAPLPEDELMPEPVAELVAFEDDLDVKPRIEVNSSSRNGLPIKIEVPETGDPFLIFDFGVVRCGLLSIEIESLGGGTVDLAWDDRMDESGDISPCRSTPNCDRLIVDAGRCQWDGFFERGLRFMKVVFRNFKGDITLYDISVKETLTPAPLGKTAKFESNDKLLEKIWNASFYTVRSYMNGCSAGDPIREKCHWFGDDSMAMRMAYYCFGEWKTWRRGLELTAQSQNRDGSFPVVSPGHFEDCNMVLGSCGWTININEYFRHTSDIDFAKDMMEHIDRHIDYELRFADNNGLLYETPGRRFLSWADGDARTPYKKGEVWAKQERKTWGDFFDPPTRGFNAIINIYWLWNLREASSLAYALGHIDLSERYASIFDKAFARFKELFWDNEVKLFRDNVSFDYYGKINEPTFCESTLFHMMKSELIDENEALNMYERIMDDDFVCCRASGGLELSAVPIMLLKKGKIEEALDVYKELWGSPINGGATTCGEEFFKCFGNSDCHIHGATPARDFSIYHRHKSHVAFFGGEVLLAPPLNASQLPFINASIPTYYGDITIKILTENGQTKYIYNVPKQCKCFIKQGEKDMVLSPNIGELII